MTDGFLRYSQDDTKDKGGKTVSAFSKVLSKSEEYLKIKDNIKRAAYPFGIIGLSQVHKAHFISSLMRDTDKKALIICPDESSASKLCDDLKGFGINADLYPARDFRFREAEQRLSRKGI